MFDKSVILLILLGLLLIFYFVIRFSAGNKRDINKSNYLSKYLFGVRVLIILLAFVGLILWFFI
tara:strand:- start:2575 stop:2766 length:192 start_codon:yes stop_codon:yes gene_type:complete